ncbi:proepiregulin-like [Gouania willdenowi]|uniref:proepiregulin-like n=1 Tax=Gouania willdenowi TaxID=441366 RepID=UPI001054BC93|nr:proepiregulin-like [Gouania willdenowi]
MGTSRPLALLPLIGVALIWPCVFTKSFSPRLHAADGSSLSAVQSEERHHVVKRSSQPCSDSFDKYCLNKGQCMFLVEVNEHHCKCERGHYGPRCETLELVVQPMGEEQTIAIIFCVCLLIVGVAGALYFCCKWCKKKKFPVQSKRHGYKGVQTA